MKINVIVPPWGVQAGALASWFAFNVTRGSGVVAGAGVELFGSLASVAVSPVSPIVGAACRLTSHQTGRQIVDASEMTAIVAGAVAGVSVTAVCVIGNWIYEETPGIVDALVKRQVQDGGTDLSGDPASVASSLPTSNKEGFILIGDAGHIKASKDRE